MNNKKISQLTAAVSVTGPDVLPIVNGGATKKVTLTTLSSYLAAVGPTGPTGSGGATGPTGSAEAYQGATAPVSAGAGATWLDTDTGRLFTRYAGVWVEIGGKHYP